LAARLGIFSVKNELEDLAFKWMNPQAYAELSQTLDSRESIVAALTKLDEVLLSRQAQVVDLCGRQKSVYSVYKKMVAKDKNVEDIMDLRALRIIVADGETDEESERLCRETLDVAYTLFQPVEGRSKDYISHPKQNGYQSLHSVVQDKDGNTFEIQVRTASMHRTAEYGLAAHWRYKEHEKSATSMKVDQQIQWARFMLTWQNELHDQQKIRPERVANAVDCGADLAPCMFPIHGPDCPFSESQYCLACDLDKDDPNYVITVVDGAVAVCEMKQHATAADLKFDDQRVPGGARSTEFYRLASIRVNKKTVDISDLASITLQMGDVVEVTRTRILSPNKSWDETDENVEIFGDLNLEVHKLPKSDAVVSESLGLI
jgi:(p)ppGpp synthase/HD superfamily hydrolase